MKEESTYVMGMVITQFRQNSHYLIPVRSVPFKGSCLKLTENVVKKIMPGTSREKGQEIIRPSSGKQ